MPDNKSRDNRFQGSRFQGNGFQGNGSQGKGSQGKGSPPTAIDQLASLCKAGGDRLRMEILQVLRQDALAVQELCAIFDMRQSGMSHHLKILAGAGLVAGRREGNSIYYRRAALDQRAGADSLRADLFAAIDRAPPDPKRERRLSAVQRARAESSQAFFQQNAHKFREQQDLIAAYEQYADTAARALAESPLPGVGLVLEVGPGDGRFLLELSPRFERVVALDNALEMLEQSRERARREGLDNIEFTHGDTGHPSLASLRADCIVVNMVLHHTPSPADIFRDLAGCLAPGGVLLITDLCRHDQDWVREACGDLWLGFEPADLDNWAAHNGLRAIAGEYLAQRNGFQVQVRLFGH